MTKEIREVALLIKADVENAKRRLDELQQELNETEGGAKKLSGSLKGELTNALGGIGLATGAATAALAGVALGIKKLGDAAVEGERIRNVEKAFEVLATGAGVNATQQLEKLRVATRGTVSDFDLLQKSAQAAQLGLDIDQLDELAASAQKLGAAVGRDATEAFDDLVTGVGRGSRLILDNLGVIIRSEDAYGDLAKQLGTTTKELTFQEKALFEIQRRAENLPEATDTAGTAFRRVTAEVDNLVDRFQKAIDQSPELQRGFDQLAQTIADVDIDSLVNNFRRLLEVVEGGIGLLNSFSRGLDIIFEGRENVERREAERDAERLFGGQSLEELQGTFGRLQSEGERLRAERAAIVAPRGRSGQDEREQIRKLEAAIAQNNKEQQAVGKLLNELKVETAKNTEGTEKNTEGVGENTRTGREGNRENKKNTDATEENTEATDRNTQGKPKPPPAPRLLEAEIEFDDRNLLQKFNTLGDEVSLLLDEQFGFAGLGSDIVGGIQGSIAGALSSAFQGDFDNLFSNLGQDLGASIGGALGTAFGGPIGGALGAGVGGLGGEFFLGSIDNILSGNASEGDNLRASLLAGPFAPFVFGGLELGQSLFGSSINASEAGRRATTAQLRERLGGETFLGERVGEFSGLEFGGTSIPLVQGLGTILNPERIEDSVAQVAALIESFTTGTTESEQFNSQLAATQLLFEDLGISAEEGKQSLEDAFLAGRISLEQFNEGVNSFNIAAQDNLVGEGSVSDAFNILADNIATNPRLALKGLEFAFIKAEEVGITTVDGLIEAYGDKLGPGVIEALEKIRDSGITNLEDLNNRTTDQTLQIFNALTPVAEGISEAFGGINDVADQTVGNLGSIREEVRTLGEAFGEVGAQAREARREIELTSQAGNTAPVESLGQG